MAKKASDSVKVTFGKRKGRRARKSSGPKDARKKPSRGQG